MRVTPSNLLALAAASTVSAQNQYTNQSAPFALQITNAANSSLDGLYLGACHSGAGLEALCLGNSTAEYDFYYNTTDTNAPNSVSSDQSQGLLVWNLPVFGLPGLDSVSQSLSVYTTDLGTNVASAIIGGGQGSGTLVHFTDNGKLTLLDRDDDSNLQEGVFPPDPPFNSTQNVLNHWYICWGKAGASYYYKALFWVLAGEPHNPTCEKVDVIRVFES